MDEVALSSRARERAPVWLLLVVFVAGAALMAFELVGSRILAPFFGNSIYVWGSLIGVFLGALSAGYATGGRLADRFPSAAALALVLALAAILTALAVALSDPIQTAVVRWNPGLRLNPLVSAIAIFGPASVLMGMVSPFAVKLSARNLDNVGATAGALYGLSTVGSIVGTVGTAFWLIGALGTQAVVLVVASALAGCSLLAAIGGARGRGGTLLVAIGSLLAVGVLGSSGLGYGSHDLQRRGNWSPVFRAGGYQPPFEPRSEGREREAFDSSYHRIRVVDHPGGVESKVPIRVLHFDNSRQSAISLDEAGEPDTKAPPVFEYLRAFDLVPATRPDLDRVLFVGLGSGAAPMRLHNQLPRTKIDTVEIDPAVVDVAREWFGYDDANEGIATHVGDGRSWLAASEREYDAIYIDAYFADSIPFHLTTQEFLEVVKDHLAPGGVVAANLVGAPEGGRSELLRSMVKTYRTRFDHVVLYPVPDKDGSLRLRDFLNVELLASDNPLPAAGEELDALRAAGLDEAIDETLRRLLAARYDKRLEDDDVPLLTDDFAPVDSLMSVSPDDA